MSNNNRNTNQSNNIRITNNIPNLLLNFKKDIINIISNQNKNQEERLAKIKGEIKDLKAISNISYKSNDQKKIKQESKGAFYSKSQVINLSNKRDIYKSITDKLPYNNNTQKFKNSNKNINEILSE